jgi:hypothetical protein
VILLKQLLLWEEVSLPRPSTGMQAYASLVMRVHKSDC